MKQTAQGIITHIENVSTKCLQLQQKHLIGFKLDANSPKDSERFVLIWVVNCMQIIRVYE